ADADNAILVKIGQGALADVGNVAREFFAAQLSLADFDVVFFDVNRSEDIFLHQPLADDNGVFEVVAVISKEGDEHVSSQSQLTLIRGCAVGQNLAFLDALALAHYGLLIQTGPLIEANELAKDVFIGIVDEDA